MHKLALEIGALACLLAGCEVLGKAQEEDITTAGARLLDMDYEQVDLVALLDPAAKAKNGYVPLLGDPPTWETLPAGRKIDLAFAAYHETENQLNLDEGARKVRRDHVQERLLGASNELCYRYKRFMQNTHSDGNFWLGTLTTIAGAAGALVTGGGSQILAGTASALSGIRAEFNQDYFQNVTVATIWKGIELRRERAFNTIATEGQDKNVGIYPIEAAVKDAIAYHAECSLVAGVEELGDSVQLAKDPGLDAVSRTLLKLNIARNIAETQSTDPADLLGGAAPGSPSASLLDYGTPRGNSLAGGDPMAALGGYLQAVATATSGAAASVGKMAHWPKKPSTEEASRTAIIEKIKARATAAVAKLTACQKAASDASIAIATAQGKLAVATAASEQTRAAADLAAKKAQGTAVVSQMSVAQTLFKADMDSAIGALEKMNLALVKTESEMAEAGIKDVGKSLDAAAKNTPDLDCAEKKVAEAKTITPAAPTSLTPAP